MQRIFGTIVTVAIVAAVAGMAARPYLDSLVLPELNPQRTLAPHSLANIENATIALFERAAPSVVEITSMTIAREPSPAGIMTGSGFFWDDSGNIVTNSHVIESASTIWVWLASGQQIQAQVVGSAADYDLAVIRASEKVKVPAPIPPGTSNNLKIGQLVYAIGSPYGLDQSLTTGVISGLKRELPTSEGREIRNIIQTSAAIYPGSSGGPLLNSAGQLIGVNTISYPGAAKSAPALGFAIPVDVVKSVIVDLINGKNRASSVNTR
jgi:2-alkenal reductase